MPLIYFIFSDVICKLIIDKKLSKISKRILLPAFTFHFISPKERERERDIRQTDRQTDRKTKTETETE